MEKAEAQAKPQAERTAYVEAVAKAEERLRAESKVRAEAEKGTVAKAAEATMAAKAEARAIPGVPAKTARCECCGRADIRESRLVRIDSSQLFYPDCLEELKSWLSLERVTYGDYNKTDRTIDVFPDT